MILTLAISAIACGVLVGDLIHIKTTDEKRRKLGQPTLIDILKNSRRRLSCEYNAQVSRHLLKLYAQTNPGAIEEHLRLKYSHEFDLFSIDFKHAAYNPITKRTEPSGWVREWDDNYATVFFYKDLDKVVPPPSPPPLPPQIGWTERDEEERIALFRANPLAFWLNPDWSDPSEPFWMREPAPLPQRYDSSAPPDKIRKLAEALSYGQFLELSGIRESNVVYLNGERITISRDEIRQAGQLAVKMRGRRYE